MGEISSITLLVGLPGSGKSTIGQQMAESNNALFIDDISLLIKSDAPEYIANRANELGKKHIIISDVNFCIDKIRNTAISQLELAFNMRTNVIFFENSPDKCLKNIERRISLGDKRKVKNLVKMLADEYKIPKDSLPLQIY